MKSFYKKDGDLYFYDSDYPQRYTVNKKLIKDVFSDIGLTKIKQSIYRQLMNLKYKNIHQIWEYDKVKYQSLDNFTKETMADIFKIPLTTLENKKETGYKVYHQGRVYLAIQTCTNINKDFQLCDINTGEWIKKTCVYNLAPILNLKTKEII